jgi:hypothetical protein
MKLRDEDEILVQGGSYSMNSRMIFSYGDEITAIPIQGCNITMNSTMKSQDEDEIPL